MFALSKLAYLACNEQEKWYYDRTVDTRNIDVKSCCQDLLMYIKNKNNYFKYIYNTNKKSFSKREISIACQLLMVKAAKNRHLECLDFANKQGCPWTKAVCIIAAETSDLEMMKFAYEHGCPWDKEVCKRAAGRGDIECLKYAHMNGCPWDVETCNSAVVGNHLNTLRYAYENECPWDASTCEKATACKSKNLCCLEYLILNGCWWKILVSKTSWTKDYPTICTKNPK